jgi:hypothetical protein
MANGYPDTTQQPPPQPLFGPGAFSGMQGMFGGLRRGFQAGGQALHPYSNRLLLTGMGLLSRDPDAMGQAMKGMIAGSALDTEDADRRKLNKALQDLQNDPEGSGLFAGLTEAEQNYVAQDPAAIRALIVGKTSGKNWQRLSDDTIFDPSSGTTQRVGSGGGSFLKGNAQETQALRYLVESGQMTEDQAAQWAAGKTITGPNGEILFISPDQLLTAAGMKDGGGPKQITGPKAPTEDQRKAKGFYDRTLASDAILSNPDIISAGQGQFDKTVSGLPGSQYITSTKFQQFDQAKRDFVNATLRRESGAAISPSEFENAEKQYFPLPGEPDEVIKQKAANRKLVIQSLRESWEPVPIGGSGSGNDPLGLH